MIPNLIELAPPTPWPVLPPGIHDATLQEIEDRFAASPERKALFDGFVKVVQALHIAGCRTVYLDGSFVTGKPIPGDFDGCWEVEGVNPGLIDPVLLNFDNRRAEQKAKYLGEMFISSWDGAPGIKYIDFLQIEKFSGNPKGIIRIHI